MIIYFATYNSDIVDMFQISRDSPCYGEDIVVMADSNSTATSLEDRTEDLDTCDNPTRDTLAEGLLCLIRPTIDSLDKQVSSTLVAQVLPIYTSWPFHFNIHYSLT